LAKRWATSIGNGRACDLLPHRLATAHPELLVRTALAPELMGAADPPRLPPAKSRA
jgi:hypothetical protein